ncbi:MAG: saccharopine dehydrogenase [Flammeovirgaceae bacterium]|nr:saccharopine dehydrogenase [Flammeovirgaceae bacterium]
MKNIFVLGAGRSSTALIEYLMMEKAVFNIIIGEKNPKIAEKKFPSAKIIAFDILDTANARDQLKTADLVISMLPASLHLSVAVICADLGVSMLTASYVSNEIQKLSPSFESKGACCIMEMGLDPGIDHMSAMRVLDRIKLAGHKLTAFETFTGGLLADDHKVDNPWQYKFTWNPRNVILAGNGVVKFIQEGRLKCIPYQKLFQRTEVIHIPEYGYFEGYANRDSLKYLDVYNLSGINTLYRGTLRRPGFCKAWDAFVQIGVTDDSYTLFGVGDMTHRQFINTFLQYNPNDSIELKLAHYLNIGMESDEMYKLKWIGIFDDQIIGLQEGTPAQILEHILKKKWTLNESERDLIVMWHKFDYIENNIMKQIQSHLVVEGNDQIHTAMSKTVGLPLGVTAKLLLENKIKVTGVQLPTIKKIYEPVLNELSRHGLQFFERDTSVKSYT